jgi:LPXTG-motif cell wall-anchored protein
MRVRQLVGAFGILVVLLVTTAPAGADTYTGPAGRTPQVVGVSAQSAGLPTVADAAGGSSGSGLPVTGTDVVGLVVIGMVLLGLGVVLVRRGAVRRSRLT